MLLPPRYTQRSNAETHSAKGAARRISITRLQLLIRFAEDHNTTVFFWQVSAAGSVFRARQSACEWIVREEHGKTFRDTWIESEWSRSLSHSLLEEISPGSSLKCAFCLNFAVLKKVISLFYVAALARLGSDGHDVSEMLNVQVWVEFTHPRFWACRESRRVAKQKKLLSDWRHELISVDTLEDENSF